MPFKWTLYWQSGKDEIELQSIQPNVTIDPSRFARPGPEK
jgi:outer membrane lipoprotein-sorting protein